jgi:hypothetical protein
VSKNTECRVCGATITATTFWKHVHKGAGCWLWTGLRDSNGYGRQCHTLAHRLAWIFSIGAVPTGVCVLHHCDTPACCNPAHLWLGSQSDNLADMRNKGRARSGALHGERNPHASANRELVQAIRAAYGPPRGQGIKRQPTQDQIAAQFGVSRAFVADVVSNRSWRHLL